MIQLIVLSHYPSDQSEKDISEKKNHIERFDNKFLNSEHAYEHHPVGEYKVENQEQEVQGSLVGFP
jgi:hypothetical protein